MKLFELIIGEDQEEIDEVFKISLVETPAIESNFVFFDKEELQFAKVNEEERMVMGPLLIPDKKILRVDGQGQPYEIFFSKETVKKLAQNYLKQKYTDQANIEHERDVNGVTLVESWVVESAEKDKSKLYGLTVPTGTWMGSFYIENDEVWNDFVKTGKVKGFSVEGLFTHLDRTEQDFGYWADILNKDINSLSENESEYVLSKIKALIKKDGRVKSGKRVEMESYSDYPDSVKNNAKRGIDLNEKEGNKCATQTGKVRAQQLAKGEPISVETIKRMYSFLSRAEEYYDPNSTTECGTISYLLWGGKSALGWSRNKLRELGQLQENEAQPTIDSTYPGEPASGSMIAPELLQEEEIEVYGYETTHFYICPGAIGTFKHLTEEMDIEGDDLKDMIRAAAVIADGVFMIEKKVIDNQSADERDLRRAEILVSMFKDIFSTVDERTGMNHDISYMDGHIEVIKSYL